MKNIEKPYAPSCERNGGPILNVLSKYLKDRKKVLEVGSGTGQHAIYFAPKFPNLTWVTSDVPENHQGIELWLNEAKVQNIEGPLDFNLGQDSFPASGVDTVFTANTFHIMPWEMVEELISLASANLKKDSLFIVYGPFCYNGVFTAKSNEHFDLILRQKAQHRGIREFNNVHERFLNGGFELLEDILMPANNQTLVYKKNR